MSENTQLTPATGYDTKKMIFSEPQTGVIPDSKPQISFKRILIQTKNDDGTIGDLIIPTERLFSFGVSENMSQETGVVNGYVMPLCLWNRDNPTTEEKAWTTTFDNIVEHCKKHLVENREEIGQYELEMNDLKKFNPLYWKKDKGKVVEGTGPTLYAKLIVSKKQDNKIVTMFFDKNDTEIQGLDLLGKYCWVNGAVKIESIFIGNKISFQVKLYEAEVEKMQTGMRRLLPRAKTSNRVLTKPTSNKPPMGDDDDDDDDDEEGSLDDDDEDDEVVPKPPTKKVVKKVVKKVKKVVKKKK